MKILLCSDSPLATSAYAGQSLLLAQALQGDKHEVIYHAQTHPGISLEYQGVRVIGNLGMMEGKLYIQELADYHEVDIILTNKDVYAYPMDFLQHIQKPWIAWSPIDTEPPAASVVKALNYATRVLTPTRLAQEQLRDTNILSDYMPYGVDMDFFSSGEGQGFRERYHIHEETFIFAFVGANQSYPSRKSLDTLLLAFTALIREQPDLDVLLFLHTDLTPYRNGIDVSAMIHALEIPPRNIRCTPMRDYDTGLDPSYIRDLYRAADILIAPSAGEGFCLPVVEAAACETPAIVTDFSALRETMCGGWKIPSDQGASYGEVVYHPLGGFHFRPTRSALTGCMKAALEARETLPSLGKQARYNASRYDLGKVKMTYWLPLLKEIETQLKEAVL